MALSETCANRRQAAGAAMITRTGPNSWDNIHLTKSTRLADLIYVDNSSPPGQPRLNGFDLLKQTAADIESVVADARTNGKRVRAFGSAWALTDIAITDGYLINTKALNASFDVADKHFHQSYPTRKRPYVVVSQCGVTIADLNVFLETSRFGGIPRALKTAGVGAGQTVAGSFSGNTHGAAISFGSSPDYIVGIQLVNGRGQSLWIERKSHPVMSDAFATRIGSIPIRDDDVFDAALVSFGSFGVITAVAVEVDPIYHLKFPPVREVSRQEIEKRVAELAVADDTDPAYPYHYEFVYNPYDHSKMLEASALRVKHATGFPTPRPVWIVRDKKGFAMGDKIPIGILGLRLIPPRLKAKFQFKQYRQRAILDDVRGTPGQLFTATITYFEGYAESAIAVSINDVPKMIEISSQVIKKMKLPAIGQVRLVHPTKAVLGFTSVTPKTAVFEWGFVNDDRFVKFEEKLQIELRSKGVPYRFHWSKNSGINPEALKVMYGDARIKKWKAARTKAFDGKTNLMDVFKNAQLERAGLA